MRKNLLIMAAILAVAGCRQTTDKEQYDRVAEELGKVNANLAALNESAARQAKAMETTGRREVVSRPVVETIRRREVVVPPTADLSGIKALPQNPTEEQITEYLTVIRMSLLGNRGVSVEDVRVDLYRKIGPGHLKTVLPFIDKPGDYANRDFMLRTALPDLIGEADKPVLKENIEFYPQLAVVAIRKGWGEEFKEQIFACLDRGHDNLLQYEIYAIVSTPEDRRKIVETYQTGKNVSRLYGMICLFPEINLKEINDLAWTKQRKYQEWRVYAARAASTGNIEALEELINGQWPRNLNYDYPRDETNPILIKVTGQPLDADKLCKWYAANKDKLYFDAREGRFKVRD